MSIEVVERISAHPSVQFLHNFVDVLDASMVPCLWMGNEAQKRAIVRLLDAAKDERSQLDKERGVLCARLQDIEAAIDEMDRQIKHLEQSAAGRQSEPASDRGPLPLAREKSFTDAVSYVLKNSSRALSPMDIRTRLEEFGYDSSGWKTDVVSSVHTILKRFLAANPPKVEESGEPRRKVYRWNWEQDEHLAQVVDAGNETANG